MSVSPIAASSQSRNKLKAFQFIEGRPDRPRSSPSNKENEEVAASDLPGPAVIEQVESAVQVTPNRPNHPPSTPATRLPLVDLVGNAEDAAKRGRTANLSPEEQLGWIGVNSPQGLVTPAPRSKKRARSSSPLSSSQTEASKHFAEKQPFDLQILQNCFKSPQVDPAADLWNRYSLETAGKNGGPAPGFAHLMEKSSPQHPSDQNSTNTAVRLRRWASCGTEWPAAKNKRRKVTSNGAALLDESVVESDQGVAESEQLKVSKMGSLVEKIEQSLTNPPDYGLTAGPSSSSPLPRAARSNAVSPLQSRQLLCGPPNLGTANLPPIRVATHKAQSRGQEADASKRASFDKEILPEHTTNTSLASTSMPHPTTAGHHSKSPRELNQSQEGENLGLMQAPGTSHDVPTGGAEEFDEFGSEDDLLAVDVEKMASSYDKHQGLPAAESHESKSNHDSQLQQSEMPEWQFRTAEGNASDDEFGDSDIDVEQFAAAEAATQSHRSVNDTQHSSENDRRVLQRYRITYIAEGEYLSERGVKGLEKVLMAEDDKSKISRVVTLRQSWFDTPVTVGSYIHVCGEFTPRGECTIDDSHGLIILHPDHLLSVTVVADSVGCARRAVLQDRIKATSSASAPQMYGHILHEIFQEALKANRWDDEWLDTVLNMLMPRYFETILELGSSVAAVINDIKSKLPQLQAWGEVFVSARPSDRAQIQDKRGKEAFMSITRLLEVEEHIWSPTYGLKGNIDASVQIVMQDETGEATLAVPFELKTGRNTNTAHIAQTALYTLLLSDRYDIEVAYGILYYMESSTTTRVRAVRHEILQMIMRRNELACYIRERRKLPPVLNESHLCRKCYAQTSCFLYHRLAEEGDGSRLVPKDAFERLAAKLTGKDQAFFQKWDALLSKEESEMMRFRRELWTMLSKEREKLGRCFSDVVLEPGSERQVEDGSRINRFHYTFTKAEAAPGFSFTESQIGVGEPIVVSDEQGHFALANGYILTVTKRTLTVAVDRRLNHARMRRPGFDRLKNQVFGGIMDVCANTGGSTGADAAIDLEPTRYRVDKDEFSNGLATVRNNLLQIMLDDVYKARELRSLIIEGNAPTFKPTSISAGQGPSDLFDLNVDQAKAIEKVMSANDYALILGMPGTGKTTTIAQLIRALVAKGKSVLLTSYTHTAVDNILLKIQQDRIGVLRLGVTSKVHRGVQAFATLAAQPKQSIEEIERSWYETPVVATTCLGINHPIFSKRVFDYCIVDEASQITLPVCLGPIRMAKTFILVGDHFQLPPLVQNKEALEGGLDVSLFKLLSESHPAAVVTLEHQYRMASDIMMLANDLVYDGRLKCGNAAVANRQLQIGSLDGFKQTHPHTTSGALSTGLSGSHSCVSDCWLLRAIAPENRVIFLNTDSLLPTSLETLSGSRITNPVEGVLVTHVLRSLLEVGVPATELGLITFYRSQLALLQQAFRDTPDVEMHTADRFQGRDKEAVVVSFVRSNVTKQKTSANPQKETTEKAQQAGGAVGNVGDLLKDWRRINVAITRARTKLIMIGSASTLCADPVLNKLLTLCKEKGWLVDLPASVVDSDTLATQSPKRAQLQPRADLANSPSKRVQKNDVSSMLGSSPSPCKGPRNALGFLGGNVRSPRKDQSKVAAQVGRVSKQRLLGGRPVLMDIVHDLV